VSDEASVQGILRKGSGSFWSNGTQIRLNGVDRDWVESPHAVKGVDLIPMDFSKQQV